MLIRWYDGEREREKEEEKQHVHAHLRGVTKEHLATYGMINFV